MWFKEYLTIIILKCWEDNAYINLKSGQGVSRAAVYKWKIQVLNEGCNTAEKKS
jgi:hypothetical protein